MKITHQALLTDGRNDGSGFLLRWSPTTVPTGSDRVEARRVAIAIRAMPSQCWFNARKVILRLEEYAEASYVEGWAVLRGGTWIEHGWVVRAGVVIDPTLPEEVVAYFPGLEFKGRDAIAAFLQTPRGKTCKRSPFFYAFGWGGSGSPRFVEAQRRCMEFVNTLVARGEQP
jgi:hypothetical protein